MFRKRRDQESESPSIVPESSQSDELPVVSAPTESSVDDDIFERVQRGRGKQHEKLESQTKDGAQPSESTKKPEANLSVNSAGSVGSQVVPKSGTSSSGGVSISSWDSSRSAVSSKSVASVHSSSAAGSQTSGVDPAEQVEPVAPVEPWRERIEGWAQVLAQYAEEQSIFDVDDAAGRVVKLPPPHPSGLAQLFADRPTPLRNVIRDTSKYSKIHRELQGLVDEFAFVIRGRGEIRHQLGVGLAKWKNDEREFRVPVLLRPVNIRPVGSSAPDFELKLTDQIQLNPVLVQELAGHDVHLNEALMNAEAFSSSGFSPQKTLGSIQRRVSQVIDDFTIEEKDLMIGSFLHAGQRQLEDFHEIQPKLLTHPVIRALAWGTAQGNLAEVELPQFDPHDPAPDQERGVGDLEPHAHHLLRSVSTGAHLFVQSANETNNVDALLALIADAAASGRTVAYVSGNSGNLYSVAKRLDEENLADLAVWGADSTAGDAAANRRLLANFTQPEPVLEREDVASVRSDLTAQRNKLQEYADAVHRVDPDWGCSAYEALQALAKLMDASPAPRTKVRLDKSVARDLGSNRRLEAGKLLRRAAKQGAFSEPVSLLRWDSEKVRDVEHAEHITEAVLELIQDSETVKKDGSSSNTRIDVGLRRIEADIAAVSKEIGIRPAKDLRQWRSQLELLGRLRHTLDIFEPVIFENSVRDYISATVPKSERDQVPAMSAGARRRFTRQAKDFLRPGQSAEHLHEQLQEVEQLRSQWMHHCPSGDWPKLPKYLVKITNRCEHVATRLAQVAEVLPTQNQALEATPFTQLRKELKTQSQYLDQLRDIAQRQDVMDELRDMGLAELLQDLAARRVDETLLQAELDLAWWSGVFADLVASSPTLTNNQTEQLNQTVSRFIALDRAHIKTLSEPVRYAMVQNSKEQLEQHKDLSEEAFNLLVSDQFGTIRSQYTKFAPVIDAALPILLSTVQNLGQLRPLTESIDLVILDDIESLDTAQILEVIFRSRQLVVIGDEPAATTSALRELAAVLPRITLPAPVTLRNSAITQFLTAHGYDHMLQIVPAPEKQSALDLDIVNGTGSPTPGGQSIEATEAEVSHVVDLIIEHAISRPQDTLALISPASELVRRVREELTLEQVKQPLLAEFLAAHGQQRFTAVSIDQVSTLKRDHVIFSVGYGKTPHGRVIHNFGPLSSENSENLILNAVQVAKRTLHIVSCFAGSDMDRSRLRYPGARMLADLLDFAQEHMTPAPTGGEQPEAPSTLGTSVEQRDEQSAKDTRPEVQSTDEAGQADPSAAQSGAALAEEPQVETQQQAVRNAVLADIADRLWQFGFDVELNYGVPGGFKIPLVVGHRAYPERYLLAVLNDDEHYYSQPSQRVRERHFTRDLEALGWSVLRIWSVPAFIDPQAQAETIRERIQTIVDAMPRPQVTNYVPVQLQDDEPETDILVPVHSASSVSANSAEDSLEAGARPQRPRFEPGLPISAYSASLIDQLLAWVVSDQIERTDDQLATALRAELGFAHRSARVDGAVGAAIRRYRWKNQKNAGHD